MLTASKKERNYYRYRSVFSNGFENSNWSRDELSLYIELHRTIIHTQGYHFRRLSSFINARSCELQEFSSYIW